ncbi:hypothetical protein K505DRAFT_325200 [Melanomma pulvis-pyrius CBS 109.77]|uniref:Uncharacterized protein n=1 Tax=Melanomma pulvis-pyrius CBS 109.77 TaxID=1314802 RepID=A0A6A6XB83_9PLEO|nr:hypothetical protein K505DRAFT_325200 [Melanomma pulvis-pyrius CBS 109.77]
MDHWGDPWADDADADAAPPKQEEVANTKPPPISAAPILLNSFLDDAQWGSAEDEGFGGWATPAGNTDPVHPTAPFAPAADPSPTLSATELPEGPQFDGGEEKRAFELHDEGWGSLAHGEEMLKELDNVISETSDSGTTIQPDDDPERVSTDLSDTPHLDDELSTRPSTSPSDISHTEAPPTESPRTSFEDERVAGTAPEGSTPVHEQGVKEVEEIESPRLQLDPVDSEEAEAGDDDFGDFEEDTQDKSESEISEEGPVPELPRPSKPVKASVAAEPDAVHDAEPRRSSIAGPAGIGAFELDQSLINELFPPPKDLKEPLAAPDEPISTTSTRKTWYRLTRKQTIRKYNTGMDDDNYVRVTWANSHIRSEARKIVARWTTEDRNSGRGHSAGASFYWDQSPAKAPHTHLRKQSIISESSSIQPAKQNVQPLSTNVPAAFNWSSSPLADNDPWRQDSPGIRSISSPIAAKHSATPETQVQESRSVSVDLTPRTSIQIAPPRTPTLDMPKPSSSMVSSHKPPLDTDPWGTLSNLDTSSHTKAMDATVDDDDEWGEMVQSPVVSITTPTADFSQSSSRSQTLSTPSSTPKSVKSSPFQPHVSPFQTQAPRHASPIVRLKGTVSPTSSSFRFNSFVPVGADVEPIGPSILKRANKAAEMTPVKAIAEPAATPQRGEIPDVETPKVAKIDDADGLIATESSAERLEPSMSDDFSAFESPTLAAVSVIAPAPVQSATPPFSPTTDSTKITISAPSVVTPTDPWLSADSTRPAFPLPATAPAPVPSEDPWSNADFSFFESAAPAPPAPHTNPLSPSDPWSVFETPVPAAPFTRPDPPAATPSPKPSISGITNTNSVQKRKVEEDEIVAEIVRGLPDLRYMLQ